MNSTTQDMAAFVAIIAGVIGGMAALWSLQLPDHIKSLGTSLLFILLLFVYINLAFEKKGGDKKRINPYYG